MNIKQAIEHRRSITFFDTTKTVSEDKIKEILKLAALAPSTMNLQPWKVITVMDQKNKELLKSVAMDQPKVAEASCVFIILADTEFVEDNLEDIVKHQLDNGIPQDVVDRYANMAKAGHGEKGTDFRRKKALVSTTLFAMNLMYAASSFELETHPLGGFSEQKLMEAFNLDKKYEPVMLIAAGYKRPDAELYPRAYRIDPEIFNKII